MEKVDFLMKEVINEISIGLFELRTEDKLCANPSCVA